MSPKLKDRCKGADSCDAEDSNTGSRLPTTGNTQVGLKLLQIPVLLWRSVNITGTTLPQLLSLTLKKKTKICFVNFKLFKLYRNPLTKFVAGFQDDFGTRLALVAAFVPQNIIFILWGLRRLDFLMQLAVLHNLDVVIIF